MYCPRCGQQQISDITKFCSRCGFQLGLVGEILANNGILPQLAELYSKKTRLTRRNGVVFSIFWFMFFLFIMAPFWGIMDVEELAGVSAIVGIFGGLMMLIGSLILLKKPLPLSQYQSEAAMFTQPASLHGSMNQPALPPQQSEPVSSYAPPAAGAWKAPDTGEFARPGSVTENTTKLLSKEEELR